MNVKRMIAFLCVAMSIAATASGGVGFKAAKPVWPEGRERELNTFFGFRAKIVSEKPRQAVLRITGCSDYRISFNGKHAGFGPARAAKGYFRVDEIPLELAGGTNVVAVEAAGYNCRNFYLIDHPAFLQAEVVSGERVLAATDAEGGAFEAQALGRLQKVARYSFQRTFSEAYRLAPGFDAWKTGGGSFSPVRLSNRPEVKLIERRASYPTYAINGPFKVLSTAKVKFDAAKRTRGARFVNSPGPGGRGDSFSPRELEVNWYDLLQRFSAHDRKAVPADMKTFRIDAERSFLFDAGLNDTGFPALRVRCIKPGCIAVKFDELLVNGEVNPMRYGCVNAVAWEFTEPGEYVVEAFEPYTMRYLDVFARSGEFEIDAPSLRTYKNPDAVRARLECSDPALLEIFEAARQTYAQNAVDVFTDCPGRERAGWNCDAYFTSRASVLFTGNMGYEDLYLENYLMPERFDNIPEGMFPMCYPADFADGVFIPNWAMWMVLQIEEYKNRGGSAEIVEAFRPKLVKLADFFRKFRNSDGLLEKLPSWVFVEWSRANGLVQDVNYPSNMLWAEVLDALDRLYGLPGYAEEAKRVRECVLRQSWNGKWFCDNAKRDKDGNLKLTGERTEVCQYYAFYFKVATPETHPELWKTLVDDFGPRRKQTKKHPEIHFANAFIGNYLRLECLSREGLSAKILEETRDYFLYMAERTGTLWEHVNTSASCNHGFASHIAVTMARDFLGVRRIDYAAKTIFFRPPENLPLDSISMDIPVGSDGSLARIGWTRKDGKLVSSHSLPAGWRIADYQKN